MNKKRKINALIFGLLTLFFTLFIFWNSLQTGEESGNASDAVVNMVNKILGVLGISVKDYSLGVFIRKSAHFGEYMVLCICAALFLNFLINRRLSVISPVYCVAVAICDEFIMQMSTAGRSPQWTDVLIDFTGALTGLCFLLIILKCKDKSTKCP